jgi:hypothetical protein
MAARPGRGQAVAPRGHPRANGHPRTRDRGAGIRLGLPVPPPVGGDQESAPERALTEPEGRPKRSEHVADIAPEALKISRSCLLGLLGVGRLGNSLDPSRQVRPQREALPAIARGPEHLATGRIGGLYPGRARPTESPDALADDADLPERGASTRSKRRPPSRLDHRPLFPHATSSLRDTSSTALTLSEEGNAKARSQRAPPSAVVGTTARGARLGEAWLEVG